MRNLLLIRLILALLQTSSLHRRIHREFHPEDNVQNSRPHSTPINMRDQHRSSHWKFGFVTALLSVLFLYSSCQSPASVAPEAVQTHITEADLETAIIYEVNIRQYSPEGTFEAFTRDIPRLKELGIRILWLMPIHPISEAKRKGTLGSYYAVQDYGKINPEFGNLEDFRQLVSTAHDNDMFVILDWVANHTGWDHPWIEEHPEYYTKNADGEISDPLDPATGESWGWTDVADLDFDNEEMREKMIEEMLYWVKEENVDGFRCDVAHQVPVDFWEEATDRLRAEKPIFMLAEAEEPELLEKAFDMQYAWEGHHLLNDIARGDKNVTHLREYLDKQDEILEDDDILMNFTSNHDENTWSGTVFERMGDAAEVMAVTTYMLPGMPLIYNGQEWDLDHRLRFFEKDTIPMQTRGQFYPLYERLGKLKIEHPALNGGKRAAGSVVVPTSEEEAVFVLVRKKEGRRLVFLVNYSDDIVDFMIDWTGLDADLRQSLMDTPFIDYFSDEEVSFSPETSFVMEPREYWVLVDN